MRYCFLIAMLIISNSSFSQVRTIFGKVVDKDTRKGIPFCVVQAKGRNEGVLSDDNGIFTFTLDMAPDTALVFYCVGYEKNELVFQQKVGDSIFVDLKQIATTLEEVIVSSESRKKLKTHILGKKNLHQYGFYAGAYGQEDAIFLKANAANSFLKDVFIYITDNGMPETKFRVHVYGIDSDAGPGTELTRSNVIVHADTGNEWVSVDLTPDKIPIGKGLFISIEWIEKRRKSYAAGV